MEYKVSEIDLATPLVPGDTIWLRTETRVFPVMLEVAKGHFRTEGEIVKTHVWSEIREGRTFQTYWRPVGASWSLLIRDEATARRLFPALRFFQYGP